MRIRKQCTVFAVAGSAAWICGPLSSACATDTRAQERGTNTLTTEWRIVPPVKAEEPIINLPPLAVVESRDDSGKTWQLSGKAPGNVAVVRQDFKLALEQQGWRLDKLIPLERGGRASDLFLWRKGRRSIMLMLWEEGAGKSGFALGMDR